MLDDDIGVDLPQEREIFNVLPDGSKKYTIFRCHAQLALLESRIYTELYSIRASNRSELQRLKSVGQVCFSFPANVVVLDESAYESIY
jgi:hypothetical protein